MDYLPIPAKEADEFVEEQNKKGNSISWSGWSAKVFKPDSRAETDPKGERSGGRWGFSIEIPLMHDKKSGVTFYKFPKSLIL